MIKLDITSIISSVIASGSLGYLNYIILEKLGVISFHKNSQDEKIMVLLLFSTLNYGLYLATASKVPGASEGEYGAIAISILLVVILDISLTIAIAPFVVFFKESLDDLRFNLFKKGRINTDLVRSKFFESTKVQSIYIFDFDNKLITCGYFELNPSTDWEYFDLSLVPFYDVLENEITYEKIVEKTLDEEFVSKTLVDFEKKIKIFKFEEIKNLDE